MVDVPRCAAPQPPPVAIMPSVEIANMPPNSHDVGLRHAEHDDEAQRSRQHHQRQQAHQHAARHHFLRLGRRPGAPAHPQAAGAAPGWAA